MKSKITASTVPSNDKPRVSKSRLFPIVGIGASAGGLEALEQYLGNIPEISGMAYVVIQHLDPTQKGMLPELLQRISRIKVFQVKDPTPVKPNCIYVIPPNKNMSILNGVLHLFEPLEVRGLRLPIDFFLRSLAIDRKELAVGIILSGMGSDGSLGLGAIKENNGIVMVQDPQTAKFDSMPRNAIDSVLVDIVAPANELHLKLIDFLNHIPALEFGQNPEFKDKSSLEKILLLLRKSTGNDFSLYKKNTIYRRIERRMIIHKIKKINSYVDFLQGNPKEIDILFKELMIGVTSFFRDELVWEHLKDVVIPDMIAKQTPNLEIRAWVPGCSTGEEAYSLAIVIREVLGNMVEKKNISVQIFATDLDEDAIHSARRGLFPANIAADISKERLLRFFNATEDGYRIKTEIREMVVFAQHNLIMHPPFTKIDILSCRNLLIYMDSELQKKIIGLFYYCLNPDGILLLGSSETLGSQINLFSSVDSKLRLFKRSRSNLNNETFNFPSSFSRSKLSESIGSSNIIPVSNIQSLTEQLLLQNYSPAGVLVNQNGDILYISGRTGRYLEPSVGKANMNIFAMLREGLRSEFSVAFRKVITKKESVELPNLSVGTNGGTQSVKLSIHFVEKPEALEGLLMVIFTDVKDVTSIVPDNKAGKTLGKHKGLSDMENELQRARIDIQDTLEEMQTSQEELKSTNEELQSTNEELQSTNEELTSSKEEMQSLNEELQTVNAELQSKVDEFSRVNSDMKNLLNSTDIATLFLDKELNIRRFTDQATKIFKLIKSDIGRPFTDLVTNLIYPDLAIDAAQVLNTLIFIQKQIPAVDNSWFLTRIMPYRTLDDRIDGLVITFINITDLKQTESKLGEAEQLNNFLLNSSSEILIKLSVERKILEFNPEAEKFFGKRHNLVEYQDFIHKFIPESDWNKTEKDINKILSDGCDGKIKMKVISAGGKIIAADWYIYVLLDDRKIVSGMILSKRK